MSSGVSDQVGLAILQVGHESAHSIPPMVVQLVYSRTLAEAVLPAAGHIPLPFDGRSANHYKSSDNHEVIPTL